MNHERYELLCALAAAHELSAAEQADFDAHLMRCLQCREELNAFRQTLDRVAPDVVACTPRFDEESHATRFADFAEAQGLEFSPMARTALDARGPRSFWTTPALGWATAAAMILVAVGITAVPRSSGPVVLSVDAAKPPNIVRSEARPDQSKVAAGNSAAGTAEADRQRVEMDDLRAKLLSAEQDAVGLKTQLAQRNGEIAQLRSNYADSEQQLRAAQSSISILSSRNEDLVASLVAERAHQSELTAQVQQERSRSEQDRQVTTVAREVRELMGARRLYMIDVYDGNDPVHANRSFGRVFYTEGKSLIFYAFDLDKVKSSKRVTFAAWGEHGKDVASIKPLGVFDLDDAAQKRWVMRVDDPDKLKSIDAIFVTVESKPGVGRPSGQKLLYAYLGGSPNHP